MQFNPGDIVSLNADDRRMVVVSKLDARLIWVRLERSDRDDMYAFRLEDLRLLARAELAPPLVFSTVPQIPLATTDSIAA
ncbi:MAG: hypothetical protein Q7T86_14595 [Hyphomicrobiaceae bacterium]|jgi:hypothetical protein|nr:hypothetical protein [Hyphomicrobiaceae bacterium]